MAVVVSAGSVFSTDPGLYRPRITKSSLELTVGRTADYAAIYRTQPNVRLCVRFLGRNIASLGLKGYRRKSATERLELEPGHKLREFLRNPTPSSPKPVSPHRWKRAIVEDLAIFDACYLLKRRNQQTGLMNAFRLPPQNTAPEGASWLWPDGYVVRYNGREEHYTPDEVVHIFGHNPEDPTTGASAIEALRGLLLEDYAAAEWREQYWHNAARMSGYLSRPVDAPKWSSDARKRFREEWRADWSGASVQAGGTPIIEDGMTFNEASFSAKDSEYLGARRLGREECAAQFFIPPAFVGILENANFSNMKEQHVSLYADTLGPWLNLIDEDLELQLVPDFDDVADVYLEFNLEEKLRGSFEEQAAAVQTATGAPWLLRDEARARFNLPPVVGGSELVVPLNVLIGGQASPRDTAPPPPALPTGALSRPGAHKAAASAGEKGLPRYLVGWKAKHEQVIGDFVLRQQSSVISKLGAGLDPAEAFDLERWNGELGDELHALARTMAEDLGASVASDFGAEFDVSRAEAWLSTNARIAAESFNGSTFHALGEAWSGVPRTGAAARGAKATPTPTQTIDEALARLGIDAPADDGNEDPLAGPSFLDPAREVFALAIASRAVDFAQDRTSSVGQFSRAEGASQAGARSKIWVVNSDNSRHAALDGETVAIGEQFSNGADWPGDPSLGIDETAGCLCSLEFGTEVPT